MKRISIAVCITVVGCGSGGQDAAPSASAAPSAAASATGGEATPASTSASSAAPAAAAAFGFSVVAEGDKEMEIYPMGEGAVLDAGAFTTLLGDGPLVQDPEFMKTASGDPGRPTLSVASRLSKYAGRAPGQMIARERPPTDGDLQVFARINAIWAGQELVRKDTADRRVDTITPWDDGRAIAVVNQGADMRFALVNSKPGVIVPGPGKPTPDQGEECPVRMVADGQMQLAGLPSGHLFAIGTECKTKKAIAERWEPKKVRGEATLIEGIDPEANAAALAAVSPEEAYGLFSTTSKKSLATWDGKAWKVEESPFGYGKLFAATDGSVWGVGDKGLFRHPKGGAWTKVELPPGKPTSAWAKDENNVWVVMDEKTLLHKGGPAGKAVKLPSTSEVTSVRERDKRWLATPFCKSIYAMLATIGPNGGKPPATFAAVSDAVKGAPELQKDVTYVVDDNGVNFFAGAKAPSVEIGEKIVAAYKAKNPKSTPMLYCHEPRVAGPLKVD